MKKETLLKVLKRYAKSLETMETESRQQGKLTDASMYQLDKSAMKQAIQIVERSNTES